MRSEVPARWRAVITDCDRLLAEFGRLVSSSPDGAVRDRLDGVRVAVAQSVEEAVAATHRAAEIDRLAAAVGVEAVTAAYKTAKREADQAARRGEVPRELAASLDSLRRQHESGQRLLNAVEETADQIVAVRTRLSEIVLSAGELALGRSHGALEAAEGQAADLATDVHTLREALAALR